LDQWENWWFYGDILNISVSILLYALDGAWLWFLQNISPIGIWGSDSGAVERSYLWYVMLCYWLSSFWCWKGPYFLNLQGQAVQKDLLTVMIKALLSFEMSDTMYAVGHSTIQDNLFLESMYNVSDKMKHICTHQVLNLYYLCVINYVWNGDGHFYLFPTFYYSVYDYLW
jgi:hypothetical protein